MHKNLTKQHTHLQNQAGFTIVELMVATMVFSVILVTITVGVMSFTRSYYKSVYAGMTQKSARDISDAVTQAVQFGTGEPTGIQTSTIDTALKYFCAGGYVFAYKLDEQYDSTKTGVYMQPMAANCDDPTSIPASSKRKQLLGNHMRITHLSFAGAGGVYNLDIKVAYGDTDLFSGSGADLQCSAGAGSEYCAVARYTTSVAQRKT